MRTLSLETATGRRRYLQNVDRGLRYSTVRGLPTKIFDLDLERRRLCPNNQMTPLEALNREIHDVMMPERLLKAYLAVEGGAEAARDRILRDIERLAFSGNASPLLAVVRLLENSVRAGQ